MSINQLVLDLKENNEDFEFYPTTDRMLNIIKKNMLDYNERECYYNKVEDSVLDIGAGTCKLKEFYNSKKYYAIEKSKTLIGRYSDDIIVVGTDFDNMTLIDKPAKFYFCNPPYSHYKEWTIRILTEGSFQRAYLIIPQRWKEDKEIKEAIERFYVDVLDTTDFLDAERKARAYVDILSITKRNSDETDPFSTWFEKTFSVNSKKNKFDIEKEEEKRDQEINALIKSSDNKAEQLVNLYNEEMARLYNSFSNLCSIDESILKDIGVNYSSVKESLKFKMQNTKTVYWKKVFNLLDEITCRLTTDSREKIFDKFKENNKIDFNLDNIEAVVIWVIKNANTYYNEQLIDVYSKFSQKGNVLSYKSNQKLFKDDRWRWNAREETQKYVLDYRLVVEYYLKANTHYDGTWDEWNGKKNKAILDDLCVIARNLGFETEDYETMNDFGQKYYINLKYEKIPLLEYKIYKNGNTHLKFNIEFAKAMNVEVSRLLGWIRSKEDIQKEFPEELAKGSEKYFNRNANFMIGKSNIKLLA